ncbi:hypothetical protein M433DRAFT_158563 [Acidomyces richmondensis BFW]|nr:MAG: hypothetical protein FE78DRAFT_85923 [Acidomyces sp. 'richmondensis']KYG41874.1 hypothetical protein M433DRAFT_158563 [Acidomyces richmondensis BFW]
MALSGSAFHDAANMGPRTCHSIPSGGTFSVYSRTHIQARPQEVYDALLDVGRWPEWNSFVPRVTITSHPQPHHAHLRMEQGVNMIFHVRMSPTDHQTSRETCTHVDNLRTRESGSSLPAVTRVRWDLHNAAIMVPNFVLKAQRTHEIEELADGTTEYRNWETFAGMLARMVRKRYGGALRDRFADWAQDLKRYVEGRDGGGMKMAERSAEGSAEGTEGPVGTERVKKEGRGVSGTLRPAQPA